MTLFDLAALVGMLCGGIAGALLAVGRGPAIKILAILAGSVAGCILLPVLLFAAFLVGILIQEGPRGALSFLRQRGRRATGRSQGK